MLSCVLGHESCQTRCERASVASTGICLSKGIYQLFSMHAIDKDKMNVSRNGTKLAGQERNRVSGTNVERKRLQRVCMMEW